MPPQPREAAKDKSALDLSLKAFKWLDQRAHDDKNGGYYEALNRDGKPIMDRQTHGPNDFMEPDTATNP